MIKSLEICNIQSHEHTKLDFVNGVNVIIGGSNQGKSAILRAFYWLVYNRPVGTSVLASHWIANDKGDITDSMQVGVSNDKGDTVFRLRNKGLNAYSVNGEMLNVVKTDVPEQVSKALRLSQTNIQRQMDAPFLLSETSGEVARYFNGIVNLNIIDRVLTNAESRRKRTKAEIERTKEDIVALQSNLEESDWVDGLSGLFDEIDDLTPRLAGFDSSIARLECDVAKMETLLERVESMGSVSDVGEVVCDIDDCVRGMYSQSDSIRGLEDLVSRVESFKPYDFAKQKNWIGKIETIDIDEGAIHDIDMSVYEYDLQNERMNMQNRIIEENRALLPKTCPVCGGVLKEDCL